MTIYPGDEPSARQIAKCLTRLVLLSSLSVVWGCNPEARGFALPDGDAARGREAFVALGCHACHSMPDVTQLTNGGDPTIQVALGGPVSRVKTYGDLVTAIINPSHRLSRGGDPTTIDERGRSKMPVYNDVLTVSQLVDLTTYLQSSYDVYVPTYYKYRYP